MSDAEIVAAIDTLLDARAPDATICPSEVARALVGASGPWRALMPAIRQAAAGLVHEGRLVITRGGEIVNVDAGGGPIRFGRPRR